MIMILTTTSFITYTSNPRRHKLYNNPVKFNCLLTLRKRDYPSPGIISLFSMRWKTAVLHCTYQHNRCRTLPTPPTDHSMKQDTNQVFRSNSLHLTCPSLSTSIRNRPQWSWRFHENLRLTRLWQLFLCRKTKMCWTANKNLCSRLPFGPIFRPAGKNRYQSQTATKRRATPDHQVRRKSWVR